MFPKGRSKADKDESASEATEKVQVKKKRQVTINFPSTNKKKKLEDSVGLIVVKAENKNSNQAVVKRDLFKLYFRIARDQKNWEMIRLLW